MKIIVVLLICFVFFATGATFNNSAGPCEYINKDTLTCKCHGHEGIVWEDVPEPRSVVTTLNVSSCDSADVTFSIVPSFKQYGTSIRVENIKNNLTFCPLLSALRLEKIELINVGCIPEIDTQCTFDSFERLDHFHIKNTFVQHLRQNFVRVEVDKFILENVVIADLKGLEFYSFNGTSIKIIDSYLNVTEKSLLLQNFHRIEIKNTTIEFPHNGTIWISGTHIHLSNNVFRNAEVHVTGNHTINLTDTCINGPKSTIRLNSSFSRQSKPVTSHGNKSPSSISYVPVSKHPDNEVCLNGRCDCRVFKLPKNQCTNYGRSIHQESSRLFFFCLIAIASAIMSRI